MSKKCTDINFKHFIAKNTNHDPTMWGGHRPLICLKKKKGAIKQITIKRGMPV